MPCLGLGLSVTKPSFISSGFNPLDLDLLFWLSTTGSEPGAWPDVSRDDADAVQGTEALQPSIIPNVINGHQVRRFSGAQYFDGVRAITSDAFAAFVVGTMNNTTSNYGRALSLGALGDDDFDDTGFCAAILRSGSTEAVSSFRNAELSICALTYATPCIITVRYDGTNQTTYVNGVPATPSASSGNFNSSVYRVGAALTAGAVNSFWNGDIAETLAIDSPTLENLNNIGEYFSTKFALSWTPIA